MINTRIGAETKKKQKEIIVDTIGDYNTIKYAYADFEYFIGQILFMRSGNSVTVTYTGDVEVLPSLGNLGVIGVIPEGFRPCYINTSRVCLTTEGILGSNYQLSFFSNGDIYFYNYTKQLSSKISACRFNVSYVTDNPMPS